MNVLKRGTLNGKVVAPIDCETKVTDLVGRVIDAPVENNPVRFVRGRTIKRQESRTTALEMKLGNWI